MDKYIPKVGFVFSTKDRVDLTLRSLASIDTESGFDLLWVDGSDTSEGKTVPRSVKLRNCRLSEIHYNVKGGPDNAIRFGLKRLLKLGYDYCGLIENDVEFEPGWFTKLIELFNLGNSDGLQVGATTVRSFESRVLERRSKYTINWNLGAGIVLFTRKAAKIILANYHITSARELYNFYLCHSQTSLRHTWEMWKDQTNRNLGADWAYAMELNKKGLVALASIPSMAHNMDFDMTKAMRLCYVSDEPKSRKSFCWCGAPLGAYVHPDYRQCGRCGTLALTNGNLTVDGLKSFYAPQKYWHDYMAKFGYPDLEKRAETDFKDRIPRWLEILLRFKPQPDRVLEIGMAHGGFLKALKDRGIKFVVGVEVSPEVCLFARERFKIPYTISGFFPDVELPFDKFDAIVGFDVIEHFINPLRAFREVGNHLNADGIFFFQTPCYRGEGENWHQFKSMEHTFLFTPKSIRYLCQRSGLRVLHIGPGLFPDDMFVLGSRMDTPLQVVLVNKARSLIWQIESGMIAAYISGCHIFRRLCNK